MPILSARAFKSLARKGGVPAAGVLVGKDYPVSVEPGDVSDPGDRRVRFTLSRPEVDREGDIVSLSGWMLDAYKNSPVVLWNHDHDRLVGRTVDIGLEDGGLKGTVEFVPADTPVFGPLAEGLLRLCRAGFVHACSVGFRPLEWSIPQGEMARGDDFAPGIDFLRQELVEWSLVGIPCLPSALIEPVPIAAPDAAPVPGTPPPVVQDAAVIEAAKSAIAAAERAEAACAKALDAERAAKAAADSAALRRRIRDALAAA